MQLYLRLGFSLLAQASFFLICTGDSTGASYSPRVMTRPEISIQNTINHLASLAKWLSVHLQTKWLWVWILLLSLKLLILCVSSDEFLDFQATIQCRFSLKYVHGIATYNQVYCKYKYSQHSSIIWSIWLNGWVFVYKLSGCGLNFRYRISFKQWPLWHSGTYRVYSYSETQTSHNYNLKSNAPYT